MKRVLLLGGLLGFAWASRVLGRGGEAYRMSAGGAWIGLPAFVAIIVIIVSSFFAHPAITCNTLAKIVVLLAHPAQNSLFAAPFLFA